jgi:hypothetical protein
MNSTSPSIRPSGIAVRPDARSRHVFARLQREWERDAASRSLVARARGWELVEGELTSLDDVLIAVGLGVVRSVDADDRLLRLVRLAADDNLAARVVLQRVLPNLAAVANRHAPTVRERLLLSEDLAAAAWSGIRTFAPHRRPAAVAQAIAFDARDRVLRSRRCWTIVQVPTHTLDLPVDTDLAPVEPMLELAVVLSEAIRAGLSDDDATFVRLSLTASPEEMAASLGISQRMVRYRRAAVVARVRAALGECTEGVEVAA